MPDAFDPYHKWLSIPPGERPPNHYRLLGLESFESDADVIAGAADRQMAHLKSFQAGKHSAESQKLLNEIAAARLCLLSAAKKAQYDQALKARQAAAQTQPKPASMKQPMQAKPLMAAGTPSPTMAATPAVAGSESFSLDDIGASYSPRQKRAVKRNSPAPILAGIGLVAALAIAAIVYFATSGGGDGSNSHVADKSAANSKPLTDPTKNTNSAGPTTDKQQPKQSKEPQPPTDDGSTDNPSEPDGPAPDELQGANEPADEIEMTEDTRAEVDPADEAGHSIDLLGLIDVKRDAIEGTWRLEAGVMISPTVGGAVRLQIPYSPPDDYVLTIEGQREKGEELNIGLVVGGRPVLAILDGWHNTVSGLHLVDGKEGDSNVTSKRVSNVLGNRQPYTITCTVHSQSVNVRINDKPVIEWSGDPQSFSVSSNWYGRNPRQLLIGSVVAEHRISKMTLLPLNPGDPAPAKALATRQPVNLLKLVDPQRDAIRGRWQLENGALISPEVEDARLQIPYRTPDDYVLTIVGRRERGDDLDLGLTVGGRKVLAFVDGYRLTTSGLQLVDGKMGDNNSTTSRATNLLGYHKTYTVVCTVHPGHVLVDVNGKRAIEWSGDPQRLSMDPRVPAGDEGQLMIGGYKAHHTINEITLVPLPPEGSLAKSTGPVGMDLNRLPVPDADKRAKAVKLLQEIYKSDYTRAKKPAEKVTLAEKLRQLVIKSEETTEQYTLLSEAQRLATAGLSPKLTIEIIDDLGQRFEVDALELKASAVDKLGGTEMPAAARTELAELAAALIEDAARAERYDLAAQFAKIGIAAARKAKETDLARTLSARSAEIASLKKLADAAHAAEKVLEEKPNDPDANLSLGKFLCFTQADWDAGLPHLAKGSDAGLAEVAKQDLGAPSAADDQAKLGDAWWALADKEKGANKAALQRRAGSWYQQAVGKLTGLSKTKTEKRLAELPAGEAAKSPKSRGITANKLVIWNTHNGESLDRGALECNVQLRRGNVTVWQKDAIALAWNARTDPSTEVKLPKTPFDAVRIEITKSVNLGGGLCEIEVYQGAMNVARGRPAIASSTFRPNNPAHNFSPSNVTDGLTQSSQLGSGYWIMDNKQTGWIEVSLADVPPDQSIAPAKGAKKPQKIVVKFTSIKHTQDDFVTLSRAAGNMWKSVPEEIGGWEVRKGLLSLSKSEQPILYKRSFGSIESVTIRGMIVPPSETNFRASIGPINMILNWEGGNENHFRNGAGSPAATRTSPRVLTPGKVHTIRVRQDGIQAVVTIDDKELYRAVATLSGTITIYPVQSTIAIQDIVIEGQPNDEAAVVAPSHNNVN